MFMCSYEHNQTLGEKTQSSKTACQQQDEQKGQEADLPTYNMGAPVMSAS